MSNLSDFIFTPRSDRAESFEGWELNVGSSVDTLSGNDTITVSPPRGVILDDGIRNDGLIETGDGIDTLEGFGRLSNGGIINTGASSDYILGASFENDGIINSGIINSGAGDDFIQGRGYYGYYGIFNLGTIYSGPGNDEIKGEGGLITPGIENDRMIRTASGNDIIIGDADIGIQNNTSGLITTGEGNDTIQALGQLCNLGLIDMGSGSDTLRGAFFIVNEDGGVIHLGDGNDRIISPSESYWPDGFNENSGLITTGAGSDIVDMPGGIFGGGTLDLGTENDTLKGFGYNDMGSGRFIGGAGIDTLTFASGSYQVQAIGPNEYLINQQMRVSGFERFGKGAGFLNLSEAAALGSVTFV